MSELLFFATIPGRVGIKKNNKRLIANGRRVRVLSSVNYVQWENLAMFHVKQSALGKIIECPVIARFEFHFKNRQGQADIDNMLGGPMDVLQKAGVIMNDSQIMRVEAAKYFGSEPRTIIELFKFNEGGK